MSNQTATSPIALKSGQLYPSWKGLPWDAKRWPHFTLDELACTCEGRHCAERYFHDEVFLDALEDLRRREGRPLVLTSACRCPKQNKAVGGASQSQHMLRIAVDISLADHDPVSIARNAVACGFKGIGFGRSFLHVDMRPGAKVAFHYPRGEVEWTRRFGFDPVAKLKKGWSL